MLQKCKEIVRLYIDSATALCTVRARGWTDAETQTEAMHEPKAQGEADDDGETVQQLPKNSALTLAREMQEAQTEDGDLVPKRSLREVPDDAERESKRQCVSALCSDVSDD